MEPVKFLAPQALYVTYNDMGRIKPTAEWEYFLPQS